MMDMLYLPLYYRPIPSVPPSVSDKSEHCENGER